MDVAAWQEGLGLAQYAAIFAENDITEALLPKLTGEDLKDLGVTSIGHRRMLLDAIALFDRGFRRSCRAPGTRSRASGRAAAADGAVLRSGRLDGAVGAARPGGSARGDRRLSPLRRGDHRARRRVCRQIYGRRCARLFRLSAGRRARRRAGGAGGAEPSRGGGCPRDGRPQGRAFRGSTPRRERRCRCASGSPPGWSWSAI
jgi:SAM domain (Sterile alpha motif)